jgi:hypothetical protein
VLLVPPVAELLVSSMTLPVQSVVGTTILLLVLLVPSVALLPVPSVALLLQPVTSAAMVPTVALLVALLVPPHAELVVPWVAVLPSVAVASVAVAELPATKGLSPLEHVVLM